MKNFFLALLFTAFPACILQLFLPWWVIAPVAFVVAYFVPQKPLAAFGAGFFAIFLLWVGYAFILSTSNDNLLAGKVAELLMALTGNSIVGLYLLTGTVGGLVSGLAALTGSFIGRK